MAQCVKCKKNVPCGCQLVGGKCDECRKHEAETRLREQEENKNIVNNNIQRNISDNTDYASRSNKSTIYRTPGISPAIFGSII